MTQEAGNANTGTTKQKTPILDNFGTDITKLAKEGFLDPVIGREKEIKRLIQVLSRRTKKNGIIVGLPGTGKSTIVNGLAQRIADQKVPINLLDKRVVELDMGSMVAGTKYRGQFEERLKGVINELKNSNDNIIIFIDEIHSVIGAGASSGSGADASNMLKPALARGEIQLIGATTLDEYRKNIQKEAAFARRFQTIMAEPSTKEETIEILKQLKPRYEKHHNVTYSDEIIENIVKLTDRYITDREFPDKAIDVLDEVGAATHSDALSIPKEITDKEEELITVKKEKEFVVRNSQYEEAAKLRDKEKGILLDLETIKNKWLQKNKNTNIKDITEEEVTSVITLMCNVPVTKVSVDENESLLNLDKNLNKAVIGQTKAVNTLVKGIKKSRLGIRKSSKPGVYLLLGPTGTGKTLLAKELSKCLFNSNNSLIRINMNEYSEKDSVSKLIGTSPGYIGYEEGGKLTNAVKNKPYSVLLLDEIEKAHPDIFDVFLQMFDEGQLTDGQGTMIDFRNVIVIMTSNIGTKHIKDFGKGIGFNKTNIIETSEAEDILLKQVEKTLKPEVLNRIDSIVVFNELSKENLYDIIDIYINDLNTRLNNHGHTLKITSKVKDMIIEKGYDEKYGARVIERTISVLLEDEITELLLNGIKPNSEIKADVDKDNKIIFKVK